MTFEYSNITETIKIIDGDFNKKYLTSGYKISGEIEGDRVKLYLTDDYGKHSGFLSQVFYGKIHGNKITGTFRISNYAFILLIVLLAVACESIVSAIIMKLYSGVIAPLTILAAEILYYFVLGRISKDHNKLIYEYLSNL